LIDNQTQIEQFSDQREKAFDDELTRWKADGQFHFEETIADEEPTEHDIPDGMMGVDSPVSGSIWEHLVSVGDEVKEGQTVSIIESMKMEVQVHSPVSGKVQQVLLDKGTQLSAGSPVIVIEPTQ